MDDFDERELDGGAVFDIRELEARDWPSWHTQSRAS
jgi:hypothetical protein